MASSVTTPTFTGSSTYASSFQQVLTKAVQMATLPVQLLQNNVSDLTSQQTALAQLESAFQSLDTALGNIGSAASGSPSATVSNSTALSASVTSSALPGIYTIQVDSPGSYSTAVSLAGATAITDPSATGSLSTASSFTLTVNGVDTTITPATNSLSGLASAINSSSAGAHATVVNLGSNASPDYRLVVTGNSLGPDDSIKLSDGSSNLLDVPTVGALASYRVNGSSTELYSDSRQITLSPGLTATILDTSSQPVTVTVSKSYDSLQNALTNFASVYNAAVNAVGQQTGQNAGALSGQSIVHTLTSALQGLSHYSSGSGSVASLNDLGLSVDKSGQMSFDASTFTAQSPAAIQQFLGTVDSGGFVAAATSTLSNVDDMATGDINSEYNGLKDQIDHKNQIILDRQTRISQMETNLEAELSQADAAIANLEAQKSYYQELFQAEYQTNK